MNPRVSHVAPSLLIQDCRHSENTTTNTTTTTTTTTTDNYLLDTRYSKIQTTNTQHTKYEIIHAIQYTKHKYIHNTQKQTRGTLCTFFFNEYQLIDMYNTRALIIALPSVLPFSRIRRKAEDPSHWRSGSWTKHS